MGTASPKAKDGTSVVCQKAPFEILNTQKENLLTSKRFSIKLSRFQQGLLAEIPLEQDDGRTVVSDFVTCHSVKGRPKRTGLTASRQTLFIEKSPHYETG